jgi:hypothetical protein
MDLKRNLLIKKHNKYVGETDEKNKNPFLAFEKKIIHTP